MFEPIQKMRQKALGSLFFLLPAFCLLWEPDVIKVSNGLLDDLFDGGMMVLLVLLVLFGLCSLRELLTEVNLSLLALALVLIISTVVNAGTGPDLWKCLKYVVPATLIVLLVEEGCLVDAKKTVLAFYLMCFLNVAINVGTMQLFPEGVYPGHEGEPQYWLGNENVFIVTVLAGLGAGYVSVWQRGKKMSVDYLLYLVLCLACVRWSATSMLGTACFLAFLLLHLCTRIKWPFDPYLHQALGWGGFFGIVVFHLHYYLSFLIVDILHKDLTLTLRTRLWRKVIKQFRKKPLLGYGVRSGTAFSESVGGKSHWVHAHDYVLDLLNKGGVLAVGAYGVALLLVARKMRRNLHKDGVKILGVAILSYLLVFIGDCFEMRTPYYGILALGACADLLWGEEKAVIKEEGPEGGNQGTGARREEEKL